MAHIISIGLAFLGGIALSRLIPEDIRLPGYSVLLCCLTGGVLAAGLSLGPLATGIACCIVITLALLALTDARHMRLPDVLTLALALLGVAWAGQSGLGSIYDAALRGLICAALAFAFREVYRTLRNREGLGLGDVKLLVGVGTLMPYTLWPVYFLLASASALCVVLHTSGLTGASQQLPFGSFLALACIALFMLETSGIL